MGIAKKIFASLVVLTLLFATNVEETQAQGRGRSFNFKKKKGRSKGQKQYILRRYKKSRHWIFSPALNASHYFGDLSPTTAMTSTELSFTRPQLAFGLRYKYHPRFSMRFELGWHRLLGDDNTSASPTDLANGIFRARRNLHFRNDIVEFTGLWVIDFKQNENPYFKREPRRIYPYVGIGFGLIYHSPRAVSPITEQWIALQPLQTEGKSYSLIQPVIPLAIGGRIRISQRLDFVGEIGLRLSLTDYLDDVSGYYQSDEVLGNDPLRIAMADRMREDVSLFDGAQRTVNINDIPVIVKNGEAEKRGNPANLDNYIVYGFRLNYHFGSKLKAPSTGHLARSGPNKYKRRAIDKKRRKKLRKSRKQRIRRR